MRPVDLGPGEALLHEGEAGRCAVVLPGVAYFSQAPLLWFAREAALAGGWSVLELTERAPAGEDPFAWMRERAARALAAAVAEAGDEGTIAVVGKSLASAAATLVVERALPAVWLTPLLNRRDVLDALRSSPAPTLLVGSPADPSWAGGAGTGRPALEVLELEGLDHSLQVKGDPRASLEALARVTERVGSFLERLG